MLSEKTMRAVEQTPAAGVAYHPHSKAVLFVHRLRGLAKSDVSAPERMAGRIHSDPQRHPPVRVREEPRLELSHHRISGARLAVLAVKD